MSSIGSEGGAFGSTTSSAFLFSSLMNRDVVDMVDTDRITPFRADAVIWGIVNPKASWADVAKQATTNRRILVIVITRMWFHKEIDRKEANYVNSVFATKLRLLLVAPSTGLRETTMKANADVQRFLVREDEEELDGPADDRTRILLSSLLPVSMLSSQGGRCHDDG